MTKFKDVSIIKKAIFTLMVRLQAVLSISQMVHKKPSE